MKTAHELLIEYMDALTNREMLQSVTAWKAIETYYKHQKSLDSYQESYKVNLHEDIPHCSDAT